MFSSQNLALQSDLVCIIKPHLPSALDHVSADSRQVRKFPAVHWTTQLRSQSTNYQQNILRCVRTKIFTSTKKACIQSENSFSEILLTSFDFRFSYFLLKHNIIAAKLISDHATDISSYFMTFRKSPGIKRKIIVNGPHMSQLKATRTFKSLIKVSFAQFQTTPHT